jgi:hypothetical protein
MKPTFTSRFDCNTNEQGETTIIQEPFNVEFTWQNIKSKITLENGEDLIKISMLLSEFLSANGIQNKLDITSNNQ